MKICSFTTVKDEEDIIESFVRYHINIVDYMIISDNCSNDNTLQILKKLKQEGLNIDILEDKSQYFDQNKKRKELLDYTMNKYNPDFVFPIDCDEFISTDKSINPRKIIEKLDKNILYNYKMINYVISKNDNEKELFIPKKMKYRRTESSKENHTFKCFFSNNLYNDKFVMSMGCHFAYYTDDTEIKNEVINDLYLAHYPVRSKKQLMNKVITGRLNNSSLHSRSEGLGFHQYIILDEIIKNGTISDETLLDISKNYGIKKDEFKDSKIIKKENICDFVKNKKIIYNKIYDSNLLSNTIKTSETIIDNMREKYKDIEYKYNSIINSKRWKIANKIGNFFEKFKIKK